jgi:hypothetical protein
MGVILECGDKIIRIGYERWHTIRTGIAEAVVLYLENMKGTLQQYCISNTSEDVSEDLIKIDKIMNVSNTKQNDYFDFLCQVFNHSRENMETIIELGLSGIIALLCKSDDNAFYSIGNSYDILDTIQLVKDYIKCEETLNNMESLIEIFETSIHAKTIVRIY